VVSEHRCTLLGLCVGHAFMWLHVCSLCMLHMCLFHLHGVDHGCSDVTK